MASAARLIYLIGPSGVGKDSILSRLKKHHFADHQPLVAHRYITRPVWVDDENHIDLAEFDFNRRLQSGHFLFHWQSHGYCYAVGMEVKNWLEQGRCVIVNGSRNYLQQAKQIAPGLLPVWMTVSEDILRYRLQQRGRESAGEIEARIQRNQQVMTAKTDDGFTIYNDQSIDHTIEQLLALIDPARG